MFGVLGYILAHQAVIGAVLSKIAEIIASASVIANVVKAPKAGTALDTAHTVLMTAALDFSKFTKPPSGGNQ